MNSKSGNGRQSSFLTDHTYAKKLEELGIFGVKENLLLREFCEITVMTALIVLHKYS